MKAMRRNALAAASALALAACGGETVGPAKYGADQCRRVALIDSAAGETVMGAEDFALDAASERLFISAYDRRAVEKAAQKNAELLPQGGVYAIALSSLLGTQTEVAAVTALAAPADIAGGLRPHGIAYDGANHEIVFINRAYRRVGRKWKMTPRLQRIGADGEMFVGAAAEAPCSANDVLAAGGTIYASYDHAYCGWGRGFEDVFRLKRSGIATADDARLFSGAAFANGLTQTDSGAIVMAATREKALVFLERRSDTAVETARIALPGGPDNLTLSFDGGVVAAAHPALWRLALNRRLGVGKAPSRIVKADPDTSEIEILFDDPSGALFSAATVGVETENGLIVGSVTDSGILVCKEVL